MTEIDIWPKGNINVVFEGKHIYVWHDGKHDNPKTKVFDVFNYMNVFLGEIRWNFSWRQYALRIDFEMFSPNSVL